MLNDTEEDPSSTMPSRVVLTVINLTPAVFIFGLYKHRATLKSEKTRKMIGSLYTTVQPTRVSSLTYPIVFLIRRSLFVTLMFVLFNYPVAQVCCQIFMTVLYIIYIQTVPLYDGALARWIETINELLFLLVNYHLMLFTQSWVSTSYVKEEADGEEQT